MLDSLMRLPRFLRDSFPSGHIAVTIIVLTYAFRFRRRLFWIGLPLSLGLVAGTLVCRFHYAVDVIAAVPLAAAVLLVAAGLERARHRGVLVVPPAAHGVRPSGRR
ncbi:MAG: phosphatase PAP2 family protein [Myxococcaceae bacterium]